LLREPDLVEKMRTGASSESLCIHCNKCMPTIYSGTRCVLVEDTEPDTEPGPGGAALRR
jgi:2,4-dienoyl-CoA reductase-like NADH-dependent reductase (Old Yellow Enzyme family)